MYLILFQLNKSGQILTCDKFLNTIKNIFKAKSGLTICLAINFRAY